MNTTGTKDRRIPWNPKVLAWARRRAVCTIEEAARAAGVKKTPELIEDWERGKAFPTVSQARRLAHRYERPFMEFLQNDVPDIDEVELVADFRATGAQPQEPSALVDLRRLQGWATTQRLNALALFDMLDETPPKFPQDLYVDPSASVEDVADHIRAKIDWPSPGGGTGGRGMNKVDSDNQPSRLRAAFERCGALVLRHSSELPRHKSLRDLRVRGVCFFATPLPVVVYGNHEPPEAQSFTLAHEFGHILRRQSGISGKPGLSKAGTEKDVEDWCNRFAAALLIPRDDVCAHEDCPSSGSASVSDETLERLAKRYGVSRHAMLIRLVTLGRVEASYYWETKRADFLRQDTSYKKNGGGRGRPSYFGVRYRTRNGDLYTSLVLEAWGRRLITNHNAAEFMGISNPSHLEDIRDHFPDAC